MQQSLCIVYTSGQQWKQITAKNKFEKFLRNTKIDEMCEIQIYVQRNEKNTKTIIIINEKVAISRNVY